MTNTRSKQLFAQLAAGSAPATYTVPAQYRTIVKELRCMSPGGAHRFVWSVYQSSAEIMRVWDVTPPDVYTIEIQPCWFVINEGQVLQVTPIAGEGTDYVMASGAELYVGS